MTNRIQLIRAGLLFSGLLGGGCDSPSIPSQSVTNTGSTATGIRIEYWPADTATRIGDTTVHVPATYRLHWVTSSLNDNAVMDTAQDDHGELLIAAHNYQTRLQAWHNGQHLFTGTLTKQLLGSPEEVAAYSWHDITYQGYRDKSFIFRAWMNVPDSDIGQEAEIAVDKNGKSRLIKLLKEEPAE